MMEFKSKALVSRMQAMGIEQEDPEMVRADAALDESYRGQPLRAASAPQPPAAVGDAEAVAAAGEAADAGSDAPVSGDTVIAAAEGIVSAAAPQESVSAEAASKVDVATGAAEPEKADSDKPEEEKESEVKELSEIEKLVGMMSGAIKVADSAVPMKASAKDVKPAVAKDADPEIDDLASLVANLPAESGNAAKPSVRAAAAKPYVPPVPPVPGAMDKQSLRAERSQVEAGMGRGNPSQALPLMGMGGAQMQTAPQVQAGGVSSSIGNVLGQAAAGAVALPFIALTSAARHLHGKLSNAKGLQAVPAASATPADSFAAKFAMPLSVANTLEAITEWKMGRIEASSKAAQVAAQALSNTEEFVVWEDKMRNTAEALGVAPQHVVSGLGSDERFAALKDEMDAVWTANADKVEAYRAACNDFERNVLNVVKEYPNSEKEIKNRISTAISDVEKKTGSMPGFGKEIGDYDQRTMMERIAELAKMIAKFVADLVAKVTGKQSSDLSL